MLFDTHAHYDDGAFDEDRDILLPALRNAGVSFIIDPGCNAASSAKAAEISDRYDFFYFAAGIHPTDIPENLEAEMIQIKALTKHAKCVAIGEIGLDYYWDDSKKDRQKLVFRQQLELAAAVGKPVIIHDRDAHGDCLEIVKDYHDARGVFHCYSGSVEMAKELLKAGWYLGFDGPITYKNAKKAVEVLEVCPLDRILIETDSPYLSPVPMRGKRNDSTNLKFIVEIIAEIKGIPVRSIEEITLNNAKELFFA